MRHFYLERIIYHGLSHEYLLISNNIAGTNLKSIPGRREDEPLALDMKNAAIVGLFEELSEIFGHNRVMNVKRSVGKNKKMLCIDGVFFLEIEYNNDHLILSSPLYGIHEFSIASPAEYIALYMIKLETEFVLDEHGR